MHSQVHVHVRKKLLFDAAWHAGAYLHAVIGLELVAQYLTLLCIRLPINADVAFLQMQKEEEK